MDEMALLKEFGNDLGAAGEEMKPATRQRVLDAISRDGQARKPWFGAGRAALPQRPARRLAVPLGAALLVGGFGVTMVVQSDSSAPFGPSTPPGSQASPTVPALSAKQILLAAAVTARAGDNTVPPPKSFVYTRTKETFPGGSHQAIRESWLSVDGSRRGAIGWYGSKSLIQMPGCVHGRPKIEDGNGGWQPCKPDPAYRPDFPTTAAGARKNLYHDDFFGHDYKDDYEAFEKASDLLTEHLMPAASRAAVFEALATIPGTTVVADVVTATGVSGVGVARVDARRHTREELIFDPKSHTLIGRRSVYLKTVGKRQEETDVYSTGVLESGIVKRVKLRPDGTVRRGPIGP